MLIDTINDTHTYLKAVLIECLKEAGSKHDLQIPTSYKTIIRREEKGIPEYQGIIRDAVTDYRMYTGKQIRDIVNYEIKRAQEEK